MAHRSSLTFCGGAGSVTGSNFLLADALNPAAHFLVDCGLFQGCDFCDEANWKPFPFDPVSIHTLAVTHAHIDHIGRIPKLVRDGFRGRIVSTEATKALAEPMLLDSMELLERDAKKHGRAILYDEKDVAAAMKLWDAVPYHETVKLPGDYSLQFLNAGHILGSGMAKFSRWGRDIIFTGDLGGNSPLLAPGESLADAEYLVIESVYGDKTRKQEDRRGELLARVEDIAKRGGTLLVPAFSTERTQDLLFELRGIFLDGKAPAMPVYLDSPLALKITEAFLAYPAYFKDDIRKRIEGGENIFSFPGLKLIETTQESRELSKVPGPKIIIAGSGMSAGGRVLAHERAILPDKDSTLLIVGYQAAGSLGRRLLEGAAEVEIERERVPVRCKVDAIFGYSAHLDGPHLLERVQTGKHLEEVFIVMGEPASSTFFCQRVHAELGLRSRVPHAGERVELRL